MNNICLACLELAADIAGVPLWVLPEVPWRSQRAICFCCSSCIEPDSDSDFEEEEEGAGLPAIPHGYAAGVATLRAEYEFWAHKENWVWNGYRHTYDFFGDWEEDDPAEEDDPPKDSLQPVFMGAV